MSSNAFALDDFGVDLTARARAGRLDPVLGREPEIARVIRVLARKTKNNPILLGEPGVGKTAIAEGLAQLIDAGRVPADLAGAAVFSLNLGTLLAGTGYRGDFEKRLQDLVQRLRTPGLKRLLFIDELHLLARAGRSEGGLDAANLLKPLLARGELPCIGASTPAEWRAMVAQDPALERRFQPIVIAEPTPGQTLAILRGLRDRYEQHHGLEITDAALQTAVDRAVATMPGRRLPDKAVDLLDEACAMLRLAGGAERTPELMVAESDLAAAEYRFDLDAVARLKRRLVPTRKFRLQLDAATVEQVSVGMAIGTALAAP